MPLRKMDLAVHRMRDAMDAVCEPMFLLMAGPDRLLRFVGLNKAHEMQTGLRSADLAGLTPHDAFPERLADTVLSNYTKCLTSAARYSYDEVLDLPIGRCHWRTTLSPIFNTADFETRRVVGIVGIASDITPYKTEIRRLMDGAATLRRQCEDVAATAATLAERVRGPVALILSLAKTLDPAEARGAISTSQANATYALVVSSAEDAMRSLDGINVEPGTTDGTARQKLVDMSHVLRDQTALVDPHAALAVTYPRLALHMDAHLLDNIIARILEVVVDGGARFLRVTAEPLTLDMHRVLVTVTFDSDPNVQPMDDPERTNRLAGIDRLVTSHSGAFAVTWDADNRETTLQLRLVGRIDFKGPVAQSRMRSEGVTAPMPSERARLGLGMVRQQAERLSALRARVTQRL
ncbi:MAG: PAS domain-containing protein [Pseudomonadota bacterium]